jgi:hypothetical protein
LSPRNSRREIAIEYASSPVAHPATQMRIGCSVPRFSMRRGKTTFLRASNGS